MASFSQSSMDNNEGFKSRVDKVFGFLSSSSLSSSMINPPQWSLSGEKVEKQEWNRRQVKSGEDDDDPALVSSAFDLLSSKFDSNARRRNKSVEEDDLEDVEDDDDGDRRIEHEHDEAWEIRSSIGLDPTLDNEEEEDEYDRMAEGIESDGDLLYVKTITDPETSSDSSRHIDCREPRANHLAAQVRLMEDAAAAEKQKSQFDVMDPCGEQHCRGAFQDQGNVKPIVKRVRNSVTRGLKSTRQVRFDPSYKDESEEASGLEVSWAVTPSTDPKSPQDKSILSRTKPMMPEHILHPSKYTHNSLDSSIDQLGMDAMDVLVRTPKPVTFIPRQKNISAGAMKQAAEAMETCEDSCTGLLNQTSYPVGIAAGEAQLEDAMEQDMETDMAGNSTVFHKPGRHYRLKAGMEDSTS